MCRRWRSQRKAQKGRQIDAFALTAKTLRKGPCGQSSQDDMIVRRVNSPVNLREGALQYLDGQH